MDSAHIVGFRELPVTAETVKTAINQTIAANEFSSCYIRPMIYLTLTFDHRVLDGALADRFMGKLKEALETWR